VGNQDSIRFAGDRLPVCAHYGEPAAGLKI
jgi:hypothetical protein